MEMVVGVDGDGSESASDDPRAGEIGSRRMARTGKIGVARELHEDPVV